MLPSTENLNLTQKIRSLPPGYFRDVILLGNTFLLSLPVICHTETAESSARLVQNPWSSFKLLGPPATPKIPAQSLTEQSISRASCDYHPRVQPRRKPHHPPQLQLSIPEGGLSGALRGQGSVEAPPPVHVLAGPPLLLHLDSSGVHALVLDVLALHSIGGDGKRGRVICIHMQVVEQANGVGPIMCI